MASPRKTAAALRIWPAIGMLTVLAVTVVPGATEAGAAERHLHSAHSTTTSSSTTSSTTSTTVASAPKTAPLEMISPSHLAALVSAGLPSTVAQYFFNSPNALFNLGANGKTVTSTQVASVHKTYPYAQAGWLFNSYGTNTLTGNPGIEGALSAGLVPAGISYIQYDPEGSGNGTPTAETTALENGDTSYVQAAAQLAHAHGFKFFFTPSVDAGMTGSQGDYPTKYTTWLDQQRGAWAGIPGVDMYSIQSQQAEGTSVFNSFVPAALTQAHSAAPTTPVDIGIGINPSNPPTVITTADIESAYLLGQQYGAAGDWNNVELGVGANVPASVYVDFFDWLYTQLHG